MQKAVTSGRSARMQKVPLMLTGPQQGYPCHPRPPCPLPCCPRSSPEAAASGSVTLLVTTLPSCCFAQADSLHPHSPTSLVNRPPPPSFSHFSGQAPSPTLVLPPPPSTPPLLALIPPPPRSSPSPPPSFSHLPRHPPPPCPHSPAKASVILDGVCPYLSLSMSLSCCFAHTHHQDSFLLTS